MINPKGIEILAMYWWLNWMNLFNLDFSHGLTNTACVHGINKEKQKHTLNHQHILNLSPCLTISPQPFVLNKKILSEKAYISNLKWRQV